MTKHLRPRVEAAVLLVALGSASAGCSEAPVAADDCQQIARANNAILRQNFLPLFGSTVTGILEAAGSFPTSFCDPDVGGPYGGFTAHWRGTSGADAVALLSARHWQRHDPAGGAPTWFRNNLTTIETASVSELEGRDNFDNDGFQALDTDGRAHDPEAIVMTGEVGGRDAEVTVNRAGMRALLY